MIDNEHDLDLLKGKLEEREDPWNLDDSYKSCDFQIKLN